MFIKVTQLEAKKMIGFSTKTSFVNDQTTKVWKQLMPRLKEVKNLVSSDLYSLQIYDFTNFSKFTPRTEFTKYALIEVENYDSIPIDFEQFDLPSGKYAVFLHKGTSSEFPKTAQYIYAEWLPNSEFQVDNRPHFEILGDKYKGHDNPESEEEVWIPIK